MERLVGQDDVPRESQVDLLNTRMRAAYAHRAERLLELLVCTREVPPRVAGDPGPIVATHSGYQHCHEYRQVVCGWLGEPLPEP